MKYIEWFTQSRQAGFWDTRREEIETETERTISETLRRRTMTAATADVERLEGVVNTVDTKVDGFDDRISAAESSIAINQTDIQDLKTRVTDLDGGGGGDDSSIVTYSVANHADLTGITDYKDGDKCYVRTDETNGDKTTLYDRVGDSWVFITVLNPDPVRPTYELFVGPGGEDSIDAGTRTNPYATFSYAISQLPTDGSTVVLVLLPGYDDSASGGETETITIEHTNFTIMAEGSTIGQYRSTCKCNLIIDGDHFGMNGISLKGNITFGASEHIYIDNCSFGSLTTDVSFAAGYARLDFCFIEGDTEIPTGTIDMHNCQFENHVVLRMSGGAVMLTDTDSVSLYHEGGIFVSRGSTSFINVTETVGDEDLTYCIWTNATTSPTSSILLLGGSTLQANGTFGTITHTDSTIIQVFSSSFLYNDSQLQPIA